MDEGECACDSALGQLQCESECARTRSVTTTTTSVGAACDNNIIHCERGRLANRLDSECWLLSRRASHRAGGRRAPALPPPPPRQRDGRRMFGRRGVCYATCSTQRYPSRVARHDAAVVIFSRFASALNIHCFRSVRSVSGSFAASSPLPRPLESIKRNDSVYKKPYNMHTTNFLFIDSDDEIRLPKDTITINNPRRPSID